MHRSFSMGMLATTIALSACGQREGAKDFAKVDQSGTAATSVSSYDPATRIVQVTATDFAFAAPDSILAGWTTFRLANKGSVMHHMAIARIDNGHTVADFMTAEKNPGPALGWVHFVGGPDGAEPGGQSNGTINLQPGQYIMLCYIPVPGNVPHFVKGMFHPFVVTASPSPGREPVADATIVLSDYAFTVQGTLGSGHHTIKVTNNGAENHEVQIVRFLPDKTLHDYAVWAQKPDGPPPVYAVGGISSAVKGPDARYFDAELTAGSYALLCFNTAPDGRMHVEHGMLKEFKVD